MATDRCIIVAVRANAPDFPDMSPIRREKVARLQSEKARLLSVAAERALCLALQAFDSDFTPPAAYRYLPSGQPCLLKGWPHISLAHGGDFGVAAVADIPIGVDIEGAIQAAPHLMQRCLHPEEWEACQRADDPVDFFRAAWVAKESYVKMTGEGLSIPLSSILTSPRQANGFPLYRFVFSGHDLALCAPKMLDIRFFVHEE